MSVSWDGTKNSYLLHAVQMCISVISRHFRQKATSVRLWGWDKRRSRTDCNVTISVQTL